MLSWCKGESTRLQPLARLIGSYTQYHLWVALPANRSRPLSRQIGSYKNTQKFKKIVASSVSGPSRGRQVAIRIERRQFMKREFQFPAPLEVDRYLYVRTVLNRLSGSSSFPAPLEVDRYLYYDIEQRSIRSFTSFPSPLEVDRYLYILEFLEFISEYCFRPLSRQIGSYTPYLIYKPITSTRYNLFKTTTSISYFVRVFISEYQINHIFFSS